MYFEWSMEQIPLRIKYLEETSGCKLDMTCQEYSPDSGVYEGTVLYGRRSKVTVKTSGVKKSD